MPPSSTVRGTARTQTPRELLSAVTPSLAHLAATSPPAASNTVPASPLFPSSDLPPSSTPQLPYPLVTSSSTASAVVARLGQMTALQSNPAALVAQMVSTQSRPQPPVPSFFPASSVAHARTETSLIQAGLNPPPLFPLYLGPSTPEVHTHVNSTSAWRAQHLQTCHAEFADNLAIRRNSRSGPSITWLKLLLFPVACGNNAHPPEHVDPSIHADDPHPWNFQILQEDIGLMDRQFERIGLVINMIIHDGLLNFSDFHRAIAQHQALPESPKIPDFNTDPDVSYLTSGWCLQQMRCVRNHTTLRCCEKAYKGGTYWCLQTLTAYASMVKAPVNSGSHSDPTLKHVFIIAPTHGNIVHGIEKCYTEDFKSPIDPAKAHLPHPCFPTRAMFGLAFLPRMLQNSYQAEEEQCLRLCRGKDPNLVPSMSSQVHSITCPPHPTTNHLTVALTVVPSSSTLTVSSGDGATGSTQEENHNKGMVVENDDNKENQPPVMAQLSDLLGIVKQRVSPSCKLRIQAKDVQEAADVFWRIFLHIRLIMHKLPPGKVINPSHHGEPVLPPWALVTNWWQLEAFLDGTIVQQGQGVGQSIYASVLAVNLMKIINMTDPDCQFSRLPNDSLLVSLRFPIPDLTSDQAGFWWVVGFLLALFSTATGQACLPVQGALIHALLLHALANPAMGGLMLPWLDLGKAQAVTADPDGKDHLKEPVPQFLMQRHPQLFDALAAYQALHAGFHQPFSIEFGSLARGPTLPSMIKDACEHKEKTALEFIYWWFDNRLERVEQLIPHLEYDIGPIVNTPQNNLSFAHGEDETLAHCVSCAFQNALKEYLRVDIKERGKQLLLAMTASLYLPANPNKKLKFQFRLLNDNIWMNVPTTKSLWSFVHGCFQTIDIGYDGVLRAYKLGQITGEARRHYCQALVENTIEECQHMSKRT
ncbi:hypothetical protein EDD85DRAFT_794675 [Armillaria nabsnona]|nr:hypothetical protein EDD85DRAFT_794675 [Armillaria nabsnona]